MRIIGENDNYLRINTELFNYNKNFSGGITKKSTKVVNVWGEMLPAIVAVMKNTSVIKTTKAKNTY